MATMTPDIFTNVHKGLRKALFESCIALGRAGEDEARSEAARAMLREALRFTSHHGENEDLLLLPLVEKSAPEIFQRLQAQHERINMALHQLTSKLDAAPTQELYDDTCEFIALYLEHMRVEEHDLDAKIRAVLSVDELASFGRRSVERTAPADQKMMLAWMLPSMTRADVEAFLGRLPPSVAEQLRPLAG